MGASSPPPATLISSSPNAITYADAAHSWWMGRPADSRRGGPPRVLIQRGETGALLVVAQVRTGRLIELDEDLAIDAARLSVARELPMAVGVVLAAARAHAAWLWTQDGDLEGLPKVNYRAKVA